MQETTEYARAMASFENYGFFASGTLGRSMRPLFREGRDVVIVQKCTAPPKKYDVVLYERAGTCVLHRVIKKAGDLNLIRGDNTYKLERVPKARVIGVMTAFNRKGKQYDLSEFSYKFYSRIWNFLYPARYLVWIAKRVLYRFKRILVKESTVLSGMLIIRIHCHMRSILSCNFNNALLVLRTIPNSLAITNNRTSEHHFRLDAIFLIRTPELS